MQRRSISLALPALVLGLGFRDVATQASTSSTSDPARPYAASFTAFNHLEKTIERNYTDVESVVVVRKGRVVFDHYKSTRDALHDVQSVTKSVLSLPVGTAIGRGAIRSLDLSVR